MRSATTILITRDERGLRELVSGLLRQPDYDLLDEVDGTEALDTAVRCSERIHLLLADIAIPRTDNGGPLE